MPLPGSGMRDFMRPGRSVALGSRGMAATSHPLATLAAVEALKAGGTAVDAGLAAVAVQGVVEPHMTGIGGDCFALYAPAGGRPVALNGSGRAPRAATASALRAAGHAGVPDLSAHAVTVPGAVAAWAWLAERFGRLGLDRALAPAIAAAEEGFVVTPRVAHDWTVHRDRLRHPSAAPYLPGGRPPRAGDRLTHPALGRTLRRIARDGAKGFYEGEVAEDIVGTLRAEGGLHVLDDLASCAPEAADPITVETRGVTLAECPPNGQGLAALLIVRVLDGFDMASRGEAERIHLLAEATKAAFRQRDALLGDPSSMTVAVDDLLADRAVEAIRARIDPARASPPESCDLPPHRDTVYACVVDADGNALSLINSLFHAFGSGIHAARSGVLLQNRGFGFTLAEGHPNELKGGKRPLHTIIPGMLMRDGAAAMPFGVMGGRYQPTGHAHLLSGLLDLGLDPQAASDAPRSFAQDGFLDLEPTVAPEVRAALEAMGHRTRWAAEPLGGAQAVWIDRERGVLWGASDHRKDGMALGF